MTPRTLRLTERALEDVERRATYLSLERGTKFAELWIEALIGWLESIAETGVQLGTEHPTEATVRTFGYKRQATILAEFSTDELRIIRVYFPGQDWAT